MTREEAKNILRNAAWLGTHDERNKTEEAVEMAISALEQMPELTSTVQTGQFDYVPIRETNGISCTECKYFKVTQEPLRVMGGLIDLGQARCEKHDLIKDFSHNGQFKYLKPCEYYEDFMKGNKA